MILEWSTSPEGTPSLAATRQEYDAVAPAPALLLDALPSQRHPDREALAGYLAFGRWAGGDLLVPEPLSPVVAEAIEVDASPIRLRPRDVVYAPRAVPQGSHQIGVRFDLPIAPPTDASVAVAPSTVAVVPSTVAAGVTSRRSTHVVPSNAFVLDSSNPGSIRARLAVAVLFAADLDADVLELGGIDLPAGEEARLAALLHAVNLELAVGERAVPADGRAATG